MKDLRGGDSTVYAIYWSIYVRRERGPDPANRAVPLERAGGPPLVAHCMACGRSGDALRLGGHAIYCSARYSSPRR